MPLILVVEQEKRYVERIVEALSPQGWDVIGVDDAETALKHKADETASLLIVNGEVADAPRLVDAFGRGKGGPGAVVLVPEDADDGVHRLGADEILEKPFTDQEIRLAVRRCLVGLSNPATQQATTEATPEPAPEPQRLTSQDLFGDMVSELESTFQFGADEAEDEGEQIEEAEAREAVASEAIEPAVAAEDELSVGAGTPQGVEADADLEAAEETAVEEELEVSEEPEVEVELEAARAAEEGEDEEEEIAEVAAAESDLEVVEEDLREAPPEPPEESVEVAETDRASAPDEVAPEGAQPGEPTRPPTPRPDPTAILEQRIRQAAEEGKRLAGTRKRRKRSGEKVDRSTDSLLESVLAGIDEEGSRPRRKHAKATSKEVDDLVGSVVGDAEAEQDEGGEGEEVETTEAADPDSPALDVFENDDREREEAAYQTRIKLIWAIILILALGILAFVLLSRSADQAPADRSSKGIEVPVSTEPAESAGDEVEAADAEPGEAEAGEGAASDEETLEQELEAQRRQLQEEIAKSRAGEGDGP